MEINYRNSISNIKSCTFERNKKGREFTMKKRKSIASILFIVALLLNVIPNIVFGYNTSDLGDLDAYNGNGVSTGTFIGMINNVVGIIQVIGSIVSVVVLIVLGIKYMMGSIEEKAEYKRTMMPYVVGAVLFFGIINITSAIYTVVKSMI